MLAIIFQSCIHLATTVEILVDNFLTLKFVTAVYAQQLACTRGLQYLHVCVCVCVCVCVFVYHCVWVSVCYHSSGSIVYFYVKLRYQQLYYGILLILNVWILQKLLCPKVVAQFTCHDSL